jgi:putative transcriptional regulator
MTQLDLAEKAGVSRQTIIALEAGKYSPSLELAFRIANVFSVPIGDVFECEYKIDNDKIKEAELQAQRCSKFL